MRLSSFPALIPMRNIVSNIPIDCYNNILLLLFHDYNTLKSHCQAKNFFQNNLLHNSQSFNNKFSCFVPSFEQNVVTKQKNIACFLSQAWHTAQKEPICVYCAHRLFAHLFHLYGPLKVSPGPPRSSAHRA